MKSILLINVKIQTIVGILTLISRINNWLNDSNQKVPLIATPIGTAGASGSLL